VNEQLSVRENLRITCGVLVRQRREAPGEEHNTVRCGALWDEYDTLSR
jgi:hypothetical protein